MKTLNYSVKTVLFIVKDIINQSLNFALRILKVDSRGIRQSVTAMTWMIKSDV